MGTQTALTPSLAKTTSITCGSRTCATGSPGVANMSVSPSITAPPRGRSWPVRARRVCARRRPRRPRRCGSASCSMGGHPAQEQAIQIRIVEQLARATVQREPSHLEHQRAVRVFERAAHILLDHQDGGARVRESAQQLEHFLADLRRQADRGLVDQEDARLEQERAADLELLLLATGERRGLAAEALADARKESQNLLDALAQQRLAGKRDAAELQVVQHRERSEQVAAL